MKYIISILMVLSLAGICFGESHGKNASYYCKEHDELCKALTGAKTEITHICGDVTQDTVTEWETVSRTTLEHCSCPTCAFYCSTVCNQEGTEYLITRLHVGYNGMRQKFIIKKERTSTPVQHKSEACWDNYYYRGTVN